LLLFSKRSAFFFEKKKQKTFIRFAATLTGWRSFAPRRRILDLNPWFCRPAWMEAGACAGSGGDRRILWLAVFLRCSTENHGQTA
jgi:hypothetical protein